MFNFFKSFSVEDFSRKLNSILTGFLLYQDKSSETSDSSPKGTFGCLGMFFTIGAVIFFFVFGLKSVWFIVSSVLAVGFWVLSVLSPDVSDEEKGKDSSGENDGSVENNIYKDWKELWSRQNKPSIESLSFLTVAFKGVSEFPSELPVKSVAIYADISSFKKKSCYIGETFFHSRYRRLYSTNPLFIQVEFEKGIFLNLRIQLVLKVAKGDSEIPFDEKVRVSLKFKSDLIKDKNSLSKKIKELNYFYENEKMKISIIKDGFIFIFAMNKRFNFKDFLDFPEIYRHLNFENLSADDFWEKREDFVSEICEVDDDLESPLLTVLNVIGFYLLLGKCIKMLYEHIVSQE